VVQVAECFQRILEVNEHEAMTEALFMAASDNFFDLDILQYNEDTGMVSLNFTPIFPQCLQKDARKPKVLALFSVV
jgi:hypothetical protein